MDLENIVENNVPQPKLRYKTSIENRISAFDLNP